MASKQHSSAQKDKDYVSVFQKDLLEFPRELGFLGIESAQDLPPSKHLRRRSSWHSSSSSFYTSEDDDDSGLQSSSFNDRKSNDIYQRSIDLLRGEQNNSAINGDTNDNLASSIRTDCNSPAPDSSRRSPHLQFDDLLEDVSPKMAKMMESALSNASSHEVIQRRLQRDQTLEELIEQREVVVTEELKSRRSRRNSPKSERDVAAMDSSLFDTCGSFLDSPVRTLTPINKNGLNISPTSSKGSRSRKGSPRSVGGGGGGKPLRNLDSAVMAPLPSDDITAFLIECSMDNSSHDSPTSSSRKSRSRSPKPSQQTSGDSPTSGDRKRSLSPIKSLSLFVAPVSQNNGSRRRLFDRKSFSEKGYGIMVGEDSEDDEELRLAFEALSQGHAADDEDATKVPTIAATPPELRSASSDGQALQERHQRKRSPFGRGRRAARSPERNEKSKRSNNKRRMSPFAKRKPKSEDETKKPTTKGEALVNDPELSVSNHCMPRDVPQMHSDDIYDYALGKGDGVVQLTCAGSVALVNDFELSVSEHCMTQDAAQIQRDDIYHYALNKDDGVSCLQLTFAGSVAKCSFASLGTVM